MKKIESSSEIKNEDTWEEAFYFPSSIYFLKKPNFLDIVNEISDEHIELIKKEKGLDDIFPVYMTDNYFNDPRAEEFAKYIGQTVWNILDSQGYDMEKYSVTFTEMWTQQHYKHSLMEQHIHGFGSVISGFYFLECPEKCSRLLIHDPRSAKVITNLPEKDDKHVTHGSNIISFDPKPGMLMFTNSWLPHSFSRHASDEPMKFVHFNLSVFYSGNNNASDCCQEAEVI